MLSAGPVSTLSQFLMFVLMLIVTIVVLQFSSILCFPKIPGEAKFGFVEITSVVKLLIQVNTYLTFEDTRQLDPQVSQKSKRV